MTTSPSSEPDPVVSASWHPDPFRRHQVRYYDGQAWTAHVADEGAVTYDPPPSPVTAQLPPPPERGPRATTRHRPSTGLSFAEAVTKCLTLYATFKGRASRSEYWWFFLFSWLVLFALSFVSTLGGPAEGVAALGWLSLILPGLAVTVRRLHDIDVSGWWVLFSLIPLIGPIMLIVFLVRPGTPEANRFGLASG